MHVLRTGAQLLIVFVLALYAGAIEPAHSGDVVVTDAGGRTVQINDASRILAVGGDITEIIYALGAQARLMGVDSTSQFPAEALKDKKNVGYMRALSTEGVISVNATVIIASERAGPAEVVKTLKTTSVPYVEIPDEFTPDGIVRKVRLVARVLSAEAEGERVVTQVEDDFKTLAERAGRIKQPVRAMFILALQGGRVVVGGQGTSADAILKLAGAQNVASGVTGFRPVPNEAIVELAPEAIVAMPPTGGNDAHNVAEQIFTLKGIESTPAGNNKRLIVMDGLYLLGFGPRAPAAARELMLRLYPDLAGQTR